MDRNALFSVNACAMIRDYGKNCVRPKGLFLCRAEKLSERIIGILHRVGAFVFVRVVGNSAFGIRVGLVMGDGQDRREEGLPRLRKRAKLFHGFCEEIFIAYSPGGGEGW